MGKLSKVAFFLLLAVMAIVVFTGCAVYTIEYVTEVYDDAGNVTGRNVANGKAFVANTSDEVVFKMTTQGADKTIEFGKTGTAADAQVQIIDSVVSRLTCIANPVTCIAQ